MENNMRYTQVEKAAKKAGVSTRQAVDMIAYDHALKELFPKKSLKKLTLNFEGDTLQKLTKISKALKISVDAVIAIAIIDGMEGYKNASGNSP